MRPATFKQIIAVMTALTESSDSTELQFGDNPVGDEFEETSPDAICGRVWRAEQQELLTIPEILEIGLYNEQGVALLNQQPRSDFPGNVIGHVNFSKDGPTGCFNGRELLFDSGNIEAHAEARLGLAADADAHEFYLFAQKLGLARIWQYHRQTMPGDATQAYKLPLVESMGRQLTDGLADLEALPPAKE